jgi:hypothetical protein
MMADQRASLQQLAERTVSELNKPLNQAISGGAALVALCLAFKPHETLQFFGVVGLEITLLTRLLRYVSPGAAVRDLDDLSAAAQRKVSSTLSKATWRGVEQLDKKPGASRPLKERTAPDNSAPVAAAAAPGDTSANAAAAAAAPGGTSANAAAAAAAPGDTSANAAATRASATSTVAKAEPVPAATGSPALIDDAGTAKPVSASTPRTSVEAPEGDGSSTDRNTAAMQDGAVTLGSGDKSMEKVSSAKAFVGAPEKSVVRPGFGKDVGEDGSGKGRASGVVELRESGPVVAPLGSVTASEDAGSRRAEASDTGLNKGATGSEGAQKATTSEERKIGEVMGSLFGSFGRATSSSASPDDKEKSTVQRASSGLSPSSQMPGTPVDASKEVKRGIFGSFRDKANTLKDAASKGGSGIGGIFGSFGADRSTAAAKSGGRGATNSVFSAFGKSKSLATEAVDGGALGGFRNAVSGREGSKWEASSTSEQGVADAKAQGASTVAVEKEENAPAAKTGLAAGASGTAESTRKAGSGRTPDADASPQASQSTSSTTKPTIPSPSAASSNGVPHAESKLAIALRSEGARSGSVEGKNSAGSATGAQGEASVQQPIDKRAQTTIPTTYATSVESKAASGSEGKKVGSAAEMLKGVSALSADKSKGKADLSEMQDALKDGNKGGADAKSVTTAENRSSMGSSLPGATNTHSTKSDPVKSAKTASGVMNTEVGMALDTSMAKIRDEAEALGNREKGPETFGSEGSSRRRSRAAAALEAAAILSGSDATPVPKPEVTPMASSGTAFGDRTQHTVAQDGKAQSNGNGRRIASATTGRSGAEGNGKKASDKGE